MCPNWKQPKIAKSQGHTLFSQNADERTGVHLDASCLVCSSYNDGPKSRRFPARAKLPTWTHRMSLTFWESAQLHTSTCEILPALIHGDLVTSPVRTTNHPHETHHQLSYMQAKCKQLIAPSPNKDRTQQVPRLSARFSILAVHLPELSLGLVDDLDFTILHKHI